MGLKYGQLLYEKANFAIPAISKEKTSFGRQSYVVLKDFYSEVMEEIEGFAEGIQDQPEKLRAFLLSLGIFETTGQCSVLAYRNTDSTVVGRNYNIAPKGKYAYISQSDVFIGREDGINEKGLFIALSLVNGTEVQPGISFHFIIRKVLEDCRDTAQAIKMIQEVKVSSANNFLVADKTGNIAVVESCSHSPG